MAVVPDGAMRLLDLIGGVEAPAGYDTIYGNHQNALPRPLTSMTLNEVIAIGPSWTETYRSSAAGRYQFLTATLKGLRTSERLSGNELFNQDLQDQLGYALLDQCGYERYLRGELPRVAFVLALAKEWASIPVLEACQGAHRTVSRGQSYYAGDGLNKALLSPEAVEAAL